MLFTGTGFSLFVFCFIAISDQEISWFVGFWVSVFWFIVMLWWKLLDHSTACSSLWLALLTSSVGWLMCNYWSRDPKIHMHLTQGKKSYNLGIEFGFFLHFWLEMTRESACKTIDFEMFHVMLQFLWCVGVCWLWKTALERACASKSQISMWLLWTASLAVQLRILSFNWKYWRRFLQMTFYFLRLDRSSLQMNSIWCVRKNACFVTCWVRRQVKWSVSGICVNEK